MSFVLCLQVVVAPRFAQGEASDEAMRNKKGDIVSLYWAQNPPASDALFENVSTGGPLRADYDTGTDEWAAVEPPSFERQCGFVFVGIQGDAVPAAAKPKLRRLLRRRWAVDGEQGYDPDDENNALLDSKDWRIPVDSLPAALKSEMLATRQITVGWTAAKNFIRRVRDDKAVTDEDMV